MKSRNITTIILEGTDGVGKSTLISKLFDILGYRFMIYHRGELSNLVYARKFNRPFYATQVGLPFLHILLICDKSELKERITKRDKDNPSEALKEIQKIDDQDTFIELALSMQNDYHVVVCNTTGQTADQTANKLVDLILSYIKNLPNDTEMTSWNEMYAKVCRDLNIPFCVKNNQPYINNTAVMVESTLHNGVYEEFTDKRYPDNLLYSLGYDIQRKEVDAIAKDYDFAYIINSKINRRFEIYDYYDAFIKAKKTCIVSEYPKIKNSEYLIKSPRVNGNDFIRSIARAKATVYSARDLAYLKLQTARLYEAIIAQQIIFVDKYSDPECEMLRQIHKDNQLVDMLTVIPATICDRYDAIMKDQSLVEKILANQNAWYEKMKQYAVTGGCFNER